jgi:hypothetical protein
MKFRNILGLVFALLVLTIAQSARAQTATPTTTATATATTSATPTVTATPSATPTAVAQGGTTACVTANSTATGAGASGLTPLFTANGGRRGLKLYNTSASVLAWYAVNAVGLGGGCVAGTATGGNSLPLPEAAATPAWDSSVTYPPTATQSAGGGPGAPTGDITVCTGASTAIVCGIQW